MKRKIKYILRELRDITFFALVPSMCICFCSAGWWWFQPYGTGHLMFAVPFAGFFLLGLIASLHDDYDIRIWIDRKKGWK